MNIIPDFSFAGYGSGGVALPAVEHITVQITLAALPGDNHQQIQAAIDSLANKKIDKAGLRGAIVLKYFRINFRDFIK